MNVRFNSAMRACAALAIAALLACAIWLAVGPNRGATAQGRPTADVTPSASEAAATAAKTSGSKKTTEKAKPTASKAATAAKTSVPKKTAEEAKPTRQATRPATTAPAPEPTVTTQAPEQRSRPTGSAVPKPRIGKPSEVGKGRTVAAKPPKTKEPVPLDDPADFGTGLKVVLTDIKGIKGVATAPGEIAGPAISVTLAAQNASTSVIDLDHVVVFVTHGSDESPSNNLREGTQPLTGELEPGTAQEGTYVFTVPMEGRDHVRVEVSYSGEAPVVAFEGRL